MKRIVFSFDAQTLKSLEMLMKTGKFETLADAVRNSINNLSYICENADLEKDVVVTKTSKKGEKQAVKVRI